MPFTEQEAREGSERMVRELGDGWMAAPLSCGSTEGPAFYPRAVCGVVQVVQTSARPAAYRAELALHVMGVGVDGATMAAAGMLREVERAARAMRAGEGE